MTNTKTKPENLGKAINDTLKEYEKSVTQIYGECGKEIADDVVKKLKMVRFGKYDQHQYSKSWAVKEEKGAMNTPYFIIYNKKHYRLTHLLEYGHVIRDGTGRKVGEAGAIPHIKPMEEWLQNQLPKLLERELGGN